MDDPESEAAQRVGTTLCNKWTLERLIGTGGMAAVYVATHKIGRREAIKILHSDIARDPELRARFEQEADAVNRFKHPGMVEVRDIDVAEDGSPFLVMELLEGEPLADLARRPAGVELGDLLLWIDELLDVLAAAHAQGIVHRDIKPDNLFVQTDGRLKVLDFGIARVLAGAPAKLITRVGATLGTAPYMPPEQIRGGEIDARADLFAVGATMFRLLAKRRIHEAETEGETLAKMANEPAPPLASVAPDVPRGVCLVIDRALMFDREQRYPDALTMQRDVQALREGREPPYAVAHLGSVPGPTTSSQTVTPDAPTRGSAAIAEGPTMAASPVALHPAAPEPPVAPRASGPSAPETVDERGLSALAITPAPASLRVPQLDPVTRPATAIGAAASDDAPRTAIPSTTRGAGSPPIGAPAGEAPAVSAVEASLPQIPMHPRADETPRSPGMGERTLRSMLGPEAKGAPVAPQKYAVPTAALPQAPRVGASPGPRTQLSGTAPPDPPPAPLAPGESIPVLAAPPPPRTRATLPGTEISVWPLVIVGVVFAAIGVSVTLWFTLQRSGDGTSPPIATTSVAPAEPGDPTIGPRATSRPASHTPAPHSPGLQPQPQPTHAKPHPR